MDMAPDTTVSKASKRVLRTRRLQEKRHEKQRRKELIRGRMNALNLKVPRDRFWHMCACVRDAYGAHTGVRPMRVGCVTLVGEPPISQRTSLVFVAEGCCITPAVVTCPHRGLAPYDIDVSIVDAAGAVLYRRSFVCTDVYG